MSRRKLIDTITQAVLDYSIDVVRLQRVIRRSLMGFSLTTIVALIVWFAFLVWMATDSPVAGWAAFGFGIWGLLVGATWKESTEETRKKRKEAEEKSDSLRNVPLCTRNPIILLTPQYLKVQKHNAAALTELKRNAFGLRRIEEIGIGDGPLSDEEVAALNQVAKQLFLSERFRSAPPQCKSCGCRNCKKHRRQIYFEAAPIYNSGHPETKDRQRYLKRIAEIDGFTTPPAPTHRLFGQPIDPSVFVK